MVEVAGSEDFVSGFSVAENFLKVKDHACEDVDGKGRVDDVFEGSLFGPHDAGSHADSHILNCHFVFFGFGENFLNEKLVHGY